MKGMVIFTAGENNVTIYGTSTVWGELIWAYRNHCGFPFLLGDLKFRAAGPVYHRACGRPAQQVVNPALADTAALFLSGRWFLGYIFFSQLSYESSEN